MTMMRACAALTALMATVALMGCGSEDLPPSFGPIGQALVIDNQSMGGTVGEVSLDDATTRVGLSYTNEYGFFVDLRGQSRTGASMLGLEVSASLESLQPGRTYSVRDFSPMGDGPMMTLIACSGPADNEWRIDVPGEEIEVTREVNEDGSSTVNLVATIDGDRYGGQSQTVRASFDVRGVQPQPVGVGGDPRFTF